MDDFKFCFLLFKKACESMVPGELETRKFFNSTDIYKLFCLAGKPDTFNAPLQKYPQMTFPCQDVRDLAEIAINKIVIL